MSAEVVKLSKQDGVGILTLNRPEVFNAINQDLLSTLSEKLTEIENDDEIRAVVLTGEGKAFCSGQDLKDVSILQSGEEISLGGPVRERYNPLVMQMVNLRKPIIAAVNGIAAGAGFSLALACDMRFVAAESKMVQAFVRIGLAPDTGSSYFLPRLVGVGKAMELMFTGKDITAEEALQLGIANQVLPQDQLLPATLAFAKKLAQGPTKAIGLTKQAVYRGAELNVADALEYEAVVQDEAGKTHDFLEGVQAFAEKRFPKYRGK
ncbi:enoyl-CoA hydratase/isomerase family protein [Hazenella sp. IB182357]|uniref:Enoyl-CoA hydratase/isomerase family protein n=1 Tax=Polycladospora coralii TaxID=2771432 RepID=A0A926RVC9_9BACL|nr:enoyl-CoA hydratase-related protein [Polycladospora coralii]MBD1373454.1 enoyl-CoA hydratase/isomerase family protein [Polycladospora coralii]MBS7531231.1 enoyl-CoA hydratase/isomerase family protein [Polycladospora coralii]